MGLLSINYVIYFYLFICAALLAFNLFYICRSGQVRRRQEKMRQDWEDRLSAHLQGGVWKSRRAVKRLSRIRELMAFQEALERVSRRSPRETAAFILENRQLFRDLAAEYRRRPAMERAFFAYVIASFYPVIGDKREPLLEQLLGYMEDSTVYSRENLLSALYALGNAGAVEHAFDLLSQQGWYHDYRLISDGLSRFNGDREALACRLWGNHGRWEECLQVGVIRFAEGLKGDSLAEDLLEALAHEQLPTETRFALVRYFQHHAFPQAKPLLLELLGGEGNGEGSLAIAAAAALASYPGADTRRALMETLHSRNWYVRQNAARSLRSLGITREEIAQIEDSGDRYAAEMLDYATGSGACGGGREVREAVTAV